MKLEYQYDPTSPKVIMEIDKDSNLEEVFNAFEMFLLACGYSAENIKEYLKE